MGVWIWWMVAGVAAFVIIFLILMFIVMSRHRNESNSDRLRRLGKGGFYNDIRKR